MNKTKIEWTDATWNPVTGCTKVSSGCQNCYAEKMAKRLYAMGNPRYKNGFGITIHEDLLNKPLELKTSRMIFVNSMSDLFHKDVPEDFIIKVFKIMNQASWHVFQVLTKRPQRLFEMQDKLKFTDNIWIGTSVESPDVFDRINYIRNLPAKIRFLSCEPLLEELTDLDLRNINWVVVGGESGGNARPIEVEWVRHIRDECFRLKIPFFFKQWGGWNKKKNGKELDGKIHIESPMKV